MSFAHGLSVSAWESTVRYGRMDNTKQRYQRSGKPELKVDRSELRWSLDSTTDSELPCAVQYVLVGSDEKSRPDKRERG